MKHRNGSFCVYLCRIQKGLLDVWRYKHIESSMLLSMHSQQRNTPTCLIQCVACVWIGIVWRPVGLCFLPPVHWTSVLCFLQHNFKWTLFYPILERDRYLYNSGWYTANLFLSWTRSLHHDAVILSGINHPLSVSLLLLSVFVCMEGRRHEGREKVLILAS